MKIRGHRRCKECGTEWSYYDAGEISCPGCGSLHSVGTDDEPTLHTATATTLDLTPIRSAIDSEPLERLAERAEERAKSFLGGYGFIDGGDMQPLDDVYLATTELRYVGAELRRRMEVTNEEEAYFTDLLRADEGTRPPSTAVPQSMHAIRGLAYATASREYRSDLRTYLQEHPDPTLDGPMEQLSSHIRRFQALDGDVPPEQSAALISASRALGQCSLDGDEKHLARFQECLDALEGN